MITQWYFNYGVGIYLQNYIEQTNCSDQCIHVRNINSQVKFTIDGSTMTDHSVHQWICSVITIVFCLILIIFTFICQLEQLYDNVSVYSSTVSF